ncbi:PqqD family protein [Candidatus Woesearchaeota archaeon]|nr:PqqD family protein [Candidatus Woesearchaeota archaeon]
MKTKDTIYFPNSKVRVQKVCDELFFLFPNDSHLHVLNDSGAWIWGQVNRGKSLLEMIKPYASRYDISPDEAKEDITAILELLVKRKALRKKAF